MLKIDFYVRIVILCDMFSFSQFQDAFAIANILNENIIARDTKREKRFHRLEFICRFVFRANVDELFPLARTLVKQSQALAETVPDYTYISLLTRPSCLQRPGFRKVRENIFSPNPVIADIESRLTAMLVEGEEVYGLTCQMLVDFQMYLMSDFVIRTEVYNGNIIMYYKGSMAHRKVLWQYASSPSAYAEFQKCYPATGDNDFEILINPYLRHYDIVYAAVSAMTRDYFNSANNKSWLFDNLSYCRSVQRICNSTIKIANHDYRIVPGVRNDIQISGNARRTVTVFGSVGTVYSSINTNLSFMEVSGLTHFDLYRFKYALTVGAHTFGAEVIDVSIPRIDDCKLVKINFSEFARTMMHC